MITPSDGPSAPELYGAVSPHGQGTAPYDVQAGQADLSGMFSAATAAAMARQPATETLLSSDQGYGEQDILAGYNGGGGDDWPADAGPSDGD
jgi:hypothetical protein